MIEQDHRGVKSRINPMLGFKVFDRVAVTIAGVECCTEFARVSSISVGCMSRAKLRPRSGMPCFRHNLRGPLETSLGYAETLHQSGVDRAKR